MNKQIYDVELWGKDVIQVEASSYDEAKKLGLVAYRKHFGSVNNLDFFTANDVVTKITPSQKVSMQYV